MSTLPTRHPVFYFDEPGHTLVFQVENVLFRPHTTFLRHYCDIFREMLSLDDGRQTQGSTDDTPIVLADVHLADGNYKEITAEGFELALRVIYPDMLMTNPPKGSTEWKEVLEISRRWQSMHLRTTAITHLAKLKWNPSDRLALATTYEVDEWMPDILRDLVIQRALVAPTDILRIPTPLLPGFITARERFRAEFLADAQSRSCTNASKQITCTWRPEHRRHIGQAIADALDSKPVSKSRTVFDRFMHRKERLAICDICVRLDTLWIREWGKTAESIVDLYCSPKQPASIVDGTGSSSIYNNDSATLSASSQSIMENDGESLLTFVAS